MRIRCNLKKQKQGKLSLVNTRKKCVCIYIYIYIYTHTHIVVAAVFQLLSCVWLFAAPRTSTHQPSLSSTISQNLLKLRAHWVVMLSKHFILCCPLLLLPSIFPSIRVFSNESAVCIRWTTYWSLSFNISPSIEYSELISFRMDCFDFLAFQGTLKNFLQHHNLKASALQHSAFFMVQLSHLYVTTGKTVALTIKFTCRNIVYMCVCVYIHMYFYTHMYIYTYTAYIPHIAPINWNTKLWDMLYDIECNR